METTYLHIHHMSSLVGEYCRILTRPSKAAPPKEYIPTPEEILASSLARPL